tara:strand:+ start:10167 stop:11426 length:1260 start_codon:yes stop_codon:yes gene_type:complete
MPTFKSISRSDIQTSTSVLTQLVDIIQEDISGSTTRKSYEHFITGGLGPGVTSSLYQTIFDQDFSLESSNQVFDITIGAREGSVTVASASSGQDASGKLLFPSNILMGREKVNIYKQLAKTLLGNEDYVFDAPFGGITTTAGSNTIDHAFFMCFKRLFVRDGIKRQTFAMQLQQTASHDTALDAAAASPATHEDKPNLNIVSSRGQAVFTDIGVSTTYNSGPSGRIGSLARSTNANDVIGTIFYDQGVVVLDLSKVMSGSEHASGSFDSVTHAGGKGYVGLRSTDSNHQTNITNPNAKFIPDLFMSASIDDFLDHMGSCRFQSGSNAAASFQNQTQISSTLAFCKVAPGEFNYSSNSTYVDTAGNIRTVDNIETDLPYSFITTIGLYDAADNLLAVAKTSRPIENTTESDLTFRLRLDF